MTKLIQSMVLGTALALVASACDDGKSSSPMTSTPNKPDDSTDNPGDTPDEPGTAQQEFLLTEWVHALVEERTSDEADPDTVDDKKIIDTDDPAAFDTYVANK